ncbi:MAG: hypothetical protein UHM85_08635 [Acutalibacteraceae bacterium]|nr:hypothetical protein [Acutalibacteraceae bacterium]
MNKDFTKEDILKKHETNIKSASTAILLSGILGLIYVVRYILSGNFNFYFSLSFTDMLLRLSEDKGSILVPAIISVVYILMYTSFSVLMAKSKKAIYAGLGIYLFDFACLIYSFVCIFPKPLDSAHFIDVIVHLFVITFLVVGIISQKKIKE